MGQQVGVPVNPVLHSMVARFRTGARPGVGWEEMVRESHLCLEFSCAAYPQYVDELEGVAEATEVSFEGAPPDGQQGT